MVERTAFDEAGVSVGDTFGEKVVDSIQDGFPIWVDSTHVGAARTVTLAGGTLIGGASTFIAIEEAALHYAIDVPAGQEIDTLDMGGNGTAYARDRQTGAIMVTATSDATLTVTFRAIVLAGLDMFQGHNVEFEIPGDLWDGKQKYARGWEGKFGDAVFNDPGFAVIGSGVVDKLIRIEGGIYVRGSGINTQTGVRFDSVLGGHASYGEHWMLGSANGGVYVQQTTNASRAFSSTNSSSNYFVQKFTLVYTKL